MRLIDFQPGDGTCYILLVEELTPKQAMRIGCGDQDTILFSCTVGGKETFPMTWVYRDTYHYLYDLTVRLGIDMEKSSGLYLASVAAHVLKAIAGIETDWDDLHSPNDMRWYPGWEGLAREHITLSDWWARVNNGMDRLVPA
jgi:hypothetical protein